MAQLDSIITLSDKILDYLLEFKKSHPDFTFSLRQRDSVQSKEVKRLESGQWFQGSGYIYVPLFKKGDSARKIKTVGFTVEFDKNGIITDNSIEISFKAGIESMDEILFHQRLASKIGIELNNHNHGYKSFENPQDITSNLHYFITEVRTQALILLDELGLKEKYVISEAEFQKHLHRINEIKISRLKSTKAINYWIFQGNPKIYNAVAAINNNAVSTWTVSAHRDKIKKGDKFILWLTGAQAGCYALGRVESEVGMMKEEDAEMSYYLTPTPQIENYRVKISIEHSFVNTPILWDMVKEYEAFDDFKGSNQGTNFTATKEQYDTFLEFVSSSSSDYEAIKRILDKDKVATFLRIIREFVKLSGLAPDDYRISFNVSKRDKRLSFLIGMRYVFVIGKNKNSTQFGFLSNKIITENSGVFTNQKGEVEAHWNSVETIENYISSLTEGLNTEITRNNSCPYRKYINQEFLNDVFQTAQNATETMKPATTLPLNQILYGPPGTGKTYTLQNEYFDQFTLKETTITREQYLEQVISELNWWQVISIAVLDLGVAKVHAIHEHEFVKIKEALSSSKTVRPTIWGQLQRHTILDCPYVNVSDRSEPLYFTKNEDSEWTIDHALLKEYFPEAFSLLDSSKNYQPALGTDIKNYEFITFHQSFSYEDFLEGIKPKMDDGEQDLAYEIQDGIFKRLCLKAEADPTNKYALFIDEINRGNVSAIFGELITLIEEDKRLGAANALQAKLPYSKMSFGVPSNLYIIGTMNTADRSVEALDTALRRRFSFKELLPDPSIVAQKEFTDYPRVMIMEKINNRIELLLDKNHTLGHAYFIKNDFEHSFKNEIIPLLQEYFYNDCGKLGLILGKGFVRAKELTSTSNQNIFADFETKNEIDIVKSYELIPFEEVEFKTALATLLA